MEQFIWALALTSHIGFERDYNQTNPHVRFIEDGVIAGAYYNSMERVSFYGGWRLEPTDKTGVELAIVTGYPSFGPVAPYVRGTYDFNNNIRVFVAPGYETIRGETDLHPIIGIEFQIK